MPWVVVEDDIPTPKKSTWEAVEDEPTESKEEFFRKKYGKKPQGSFSDAFNLNTFGAGLAGVAEGLVPGIEVLPKSLDLTEMEKKARTAGNIAGSFAPTSLALRGGSKLASMAASKAKLPNLAQKGWNALTNLLGAGVAGAGLNVTESLVKGEMPSAESAAKHGLMWSALEGGLRAAGKLPIFKQALESASQKMNIPESKAMELVAQDLKDMGLSGQAPEIVQQAAFKQLEAMATGQYAARSAEREGTRAVEQLNKEFNLPKSPELPPYQPAESPAISKVMEAESAPVVAEEALYGNKPFHEFHAPVNSDVQFGQQIKQSIKEWEKAQEAVYKPLYEDLKASSNAVELNTQRTAGALKDLIAEARKLETKFAGNTQYITTLQSALKDLGYTPRLDKKGKPMMRKDGTYVEMVKTKEVSAAKGLDLKKRLNEIINFETEAPLSQRLLKKVPSILKEDLRSSYSKTPDLLSKFDAAEQKFAETQTALNKHNVQKVLKNPTPETIEQSLSNPTVFNQLKAVMDPKQFQMLEKRILGKVAEASERAAKKLVRDYEPYLSPSAIADAKALLREKIPPTKAPKPTKVIAAPKEAVNPKTRLLKEITEAAETGRMPTQTIKDFQTERGKKFVKNALKDHPQRKEILDFLYKENVNNKLSKALSKDGRIDTAKMGELLKDGEFRKEIIEAYGPSALKTLDDLHGAAPRLKKINETINKFEAITTAKPAKRLGEKQPGERGKELLKATKDKEPLFAKKFNELSEILGPEGRGILTGILGVTLGPAKGIAVAGAAIAMRHLLQNKTAQIKLKDLLKNTTAYKTDPTKTIQSLQSFLVSMYALQD
jgi:hypothetical protein